jgi:hypothetical protein
MKTKKRLTEFLDPRSLNPTLSDIAQALETPVEKVYLPEGKEWKWPDMFYGVIEGEGAKFGSYRALVCWLEAIIQMLSSCNDWQTLEAMIEAAEWELQQNYPYPDEHKKRLQEVLAQQKVRLEELKAQAAGLIRAWEWARGWAPVLESCPNQKTLNLALQLYTAQKPQFEVYAQVFDFIRQVGRQRREYLRSLETARA